MCMKVTWPRSRNQLKWNRSVSSSGGRQLPDKMSRLDMRDENDLLDDHRKIQVKDKNAFIDVLPPVDFNAEKGRHEGCSQR